MKPIDPYDQLAPYYQKYSKKKSKYLQAIDRIIIQEAPSNSQSLLDIGSGDGLRAMGIASKLKIKRVILSDASREMIKRCRQLHPTAVWHVSAENLPQTNSSFDIITCLWNVLGHIESRQKRIIALKKMRENLSENGVIFLDVNNRHNASSYGWLKVLGRILIDTILPDEKRGNTSFNWQIGGKTFHGMGHLFTLQEIENIIRESGLVIEKRYVVNYKNGKIGRTFLEGQLFYIVEKRNNYIVAGLSSSFIK